MTIPDPDLRWDGSFGHYRFGEIDWEEFYQVIKGEGICNYERVEAKHKAWEDGTWVREGAMAYSQKQEVIQSAA